MMPLISSREILAVPLKFMCSTQCDTPVRPGRSSLEPTLYQHHTDASGAVCSSWMSTFKPLSSVVVRIQIIIKSWDTHARVEGYRQPAAHGLSNESRPARKRAADARAVAGDGSLRKDS